MSDPLMKVQSNEALLLDNDPVSLVSTPNGGVREIQVFPSSASTSSISFVQTFSTNVVLERQWLLTFREAFFVEYEAGTADKAIDRATLKRALVPAPNAINRIIKNANVYINNTMLSATPSVYCEAVNEYLDEAHHKELGSMGCSSPDYHGSLVAIQNAVAGNRIYEEPGLYGETSRVNISRIEQVTAPANAVKEKLRVYFNITVPLMHPFLNILGNNKQSFKQVRQINVDLTLAAPAGAFYEVGKARDVGPTDCVAALNFVPTTANVLLQLRTYVPNESIPGKVAHSFIKMDNPRIYDFTGLGNYGSTASVSTGSIQLGTVPTKMLVYAKRRGDFVANQPNAFGVIKKITVNNSAGVGMLSNATQEQLYQMCSRDSGLKMSWNQLSLLKGSPILIDIAQNFSGLIPNTKSTNTFDITVDLEEISMLQLQQLKSEITYGHLL